MRLLFFNPENDLALAANDPHYTPPASARQMAADLQLLPSLWAAPDDLILLRDGSACSPIPPAAIFNATAIAPSPSSFLKNEATLLPWGWSPLTLTQLRKAGIPETFLPSEAEIQTFRTFSGRATAADILGQLHHKFAEMGLAQHFVGEAYVCTTLDEARRHHRHFGETIFKQPWSGSGRGLLPAHQGSLTEKNQAWLLRTLRQQGYVMAEPAYSKARDFALEFWRHPDGRVTYEGLSLFHTTDGGVYAGNIVASEERKLELIGGSMGILLPVHSSLVSLLQSALSALPPTFYAGPIGIDMLLTTDGRIHPCIEINFRMTMGWLALQLRSHQSDSGVGTFNIIFSEGHYKAIYKPTRE